MRKLTDKQRAVAKESCGLVLLALGLSLGVVGLAVVGGWFLLPFLIDGLRGR